MLQGLQELKGELTTLWMSRKASQKRQTVNHMLTSSQGDEYLKNIPGKEQSTCKSKQSGGAWGVSKTSRNVVGYDLFLLTLLTPR